MLPPFLISHRGAGGIAPENTISSIQKAIDIGVPFIEIDIRRSKDGVLTVIHDATVERTTDGKGRVEELTWRELSALDAGSWFGEAYRGTRIPDLEEVLTRIKVTPVTLIIEVKDPDRYPGIDEQLVALLEKHGMEGKVVVISFDRDWMEGFRRNNPGITAGNLYVSIDGSMNNRDGKRSSGGEEGRSGSTGEATGGDSDGEEGESGSVREETDRDSAGKERRGVPRILDVHWSSLLLRPFFPRRMHNKGGIVIAWTVDSSFLMRLLFSVGVDGITTNRPDIGMSVIRSRRKESPSTASEVDRGYGEGDPKSSTKSRGVPSEDAPIPSTMKAIVLRGKGMHNVSIEKVPVPRPGPNQLLAKVDAAGVCSSIFKIVAQGEDHTFFNGWDPAQWPVILGDEGSVTLVEIGENLRDRYRVGERYGIQPAVDVAPINHRERYRNNAEGMRKTSVGYTLGGHLAEYMLVTEEVLAGKCLIRVPDNTMPFFAVSMAEPVSCVVSAQNRHIHLYKDGIDSPRQSKLGIKEKGTCVVVGVGKMGKIHVELAIRYGPARIVAVDPVKDNLAWIAEMLGPKAHERGIELVTTTPDTAAEILTRLTNGELADDVIVATGDRKAQNGAFELAGFCGVVNLFGGLKRGDSILELDNIRVHYDEVKVVGSSGGDPHDYRETLEAIHNNDIDVGKYVAGVGGLENAKEVLELMEAGKLSGKAILYPQLKPTPFTTVDGWDAEQERRCIDENRK